METNTNRTYMYFVVVTLVALILALANETGVAVHEIF